jgi:hypothetical protein
MKINISVKHLFYAAIVTAGVANAWYSARQVPDYGLHDYLWYGSLEFLAAALLIGNMYVYAQAKNMFGWTLLLGIASRVMIMISIGVLYAQKATGEMHFYDVPEFWQHESFAFIVGAVEFVASILSNSAEVQLRELLTAETQKSRNAESRNAELAHEIELLNSRIVAGDTHYKHLDQRFRFLLLESGIAEAEFRKRYEKSGKYLPPMPDAPPPVSITIHNSASAETVQSATHQQVTVLQNGGKAESEAVETLNFRKAETVQQQVLEVQMQNAEIRIAERGIAEIQKAETQNAESRISEVQNSGSAETQKVEVWNSENTETRNAEVQNGGTAENQKSRIADLQDLEARNAATRARLQAENNQSISMKTTKTTTTETQEITLTATQRYTYTYMILPATEMQKLIEAGMRAAVKSQEFTRQQLMNFADKQAEPTRAYWQNVAKNEAYHELRLPD